MADNATAIQPAKEVEREDALELRQGDDGRRSIENDPVWKALI
jgi:hypothetical protein